MDIKNKAVKMGERNQTFSILCKMDEFGFICPFRVCLQFPPDSQSSVLSMLGG